MIGLESVKRVEKLNFSIRFYLFIEQLGKFKSKVVSFTKFSTATFYVNEWKNVQSFFVKIYLRKENRHQIATLHKT